MKNANSDSFRLGIKNINSLYDNLSKTIGMTTTGWYKAVISDNFDVIVKETTNDWEAVATNLIIEKDHKNRLVMLDTIEQCGRKYMVLTYPGRKEKAQQLLQGRLEQYKKGIIPFVFGTDEELEVAREQLLNRKSKIR